MKNKAYHFLLVLAVTLSVIAGAAASQLTQKKAISTEAFELVDEAGNTRVKIGIAPDGKAFLHIYDENGKIIWEAPPLAHVVPVGALMPQKKTPSDTSQLGLGVSPLTR